MFHKASEILLLALPQIVLLKKKIVTLWVEDENINTILQGHKIGVDIFEERYAGGVFDFFISVLDGKIEVGDCPIIGSFLDYLKDRDISAEELFVICSHFRQAMIDYAVGVTDRPIELSKELSFVFDLNFTGVLKRYTDTIFQKDQEIAKHEKLLQEYKKAIDESAIVCKTDTDGIITFVNTNFIKRCGYSKEELIGARHEIVWDTDESGNLFEKIDKKLSKGEVFHDTVKNRRKDDREYYVDMTMIPIYDHNADINEYMEISYEVTTLIEATREAVAADKAKEYFLSNMSHEIRTPLNAILGFVTLLEDEILSDRHKQYLNIIHNSGENLLSIMNDILDFSKLQSGEFMIEPQPFNIHEELGKTLELFVSSANEKNITLLSYFDPKIPHILVADILRIKQIASNFISNAIKFSPPSSYIQVNVFCEDKNLHISVKDWGIGLDKSDIAKIFDPFSQVKSGAEQLLAGTGLGLSICKKLAERMLGTIDVVSAKSKGSQFSLIVPVEVQESTNRHLLDSKPFRDMKIALLRFGDSDSKVLDSLEYYLDFFHFKRDIITIEEIDSYDLTFFLDEEVPTSVIDTLKAKDKCMIALMNQLSDRYDKCKYITPLFSPFYCEKLYQAFLHVINNSLDNIKVQKKQQRRFKADMLVAEDNGANQELIKVILKRYGIDFVMVDDGKKAVEAFKNSSFDMILMDEQMPVMTGLEATKEILEIEKKDKRVHTPIIALTANVIKGVKERGIKSGYDEFLGKPIIVKELERVFELYLVETDSQDFEFIESEDRGDDSFVDYKVLQEELQLGIEQLKVLLKIYVKKMDEILPKLSNAISQQDFEQIKKFSHNIKGSSANFRFAQMQRVAKVIEDSASEGDVDFDFAEAFELLQREYKKIFAKR